MTAVAGSIQEITLNGRPFPVAADAKVMRGLGGYENAVEPNGDGTARLIKTRVPWALESITLSVDDSRGDQEFLQNTANLKDFFNTDITFASQAVWSGKGQITDKIQYDSSKGTCEISMQGPGNQTQH